MVFKKLSIPVLWTKVASALEGLRNIGYEWFKANLDSEEVITTAGRL